MKRKLIEKVPYMGAAETVMPDNGVTYGLIGRAGTFEVDGEPHLFFETYATNRSLEEPNYRLVINKKEYASYYPLAMKWTSEGLNSSNLVEIWRGGETRDDNYFKLGPNPSWQRVSGPVWVPGEDEDIIEKWAGFREKHHGWRDDIQTAIKKIKREKEEKRLDRRESAFFERCAKIPKIPEAFKDYCLSMLDTENLIFYKRKGAKALCSCSKCGAEYQIQTATSAAWPGSLMRHIDEVPRDKKETACKICGVQAKYKPAGRCRPSYRNVSINVYLLQPWEEKYLILRKFEATKELHLSGPETVDLQEQGRSFIGQRSQPTRDWYLWDNWTRKAKWCDYNIGGMNQLSFGRGMCYVEGLGSNFKYCQIQHYLDRKGQEADAEDYLLMYQKMGHHLEMMEKTMPKMADWLLDGGGYREHFDRKAKKPNDFLMVRPERMKFIVEEWGGSSPVLRSLQMERASGRHWTDRELKFAELMGADERIVTVLMKYTTIMKAANYCEKGATGPGLGFSIDVRHKALEWLDYIQMREEMGYPIRNSIDIFPADLHAEHQRLVIEKNAEKLARQKEEKEKMFAGISRRYRNIKRKYTWQYDGYMIRPAKSAAEIIEEGRKLHHCVGGDNYLKKHCEGKSTILFLRLATDPNTPLITVELEDGRIKQWFGVNDTKPEKKFFDKWLKEWLESMKPEEERILVKAV